MPDVKDFKLPKPLKRKWLAALRGRKYKQGKGTLFDEGDNTFCCLGVLGSVCGLSNLAMKEKAFLEDGLEYDIGIEIPKVIQQTFAVFNDGTGNDAETEVDIRDYLKSKKSMVRMSPKRKSFGEIANWIEKNS